MKQAVLGGVAMFLLAACFFGFGWYISDLRFKAFEYNTTYTHAKESDSLKTVIKDREQVLVQLADSSTAYRQAVTDSLSRVRVRLANVLKTLNSDTPAVVNTEELQDVLKSCSQMFNTCEQTVSKQKEENEALIAQNADLSKKLRADSIKYEYDRRAWYRKESAFAVKQKVGTIKTAGLTTVAMGAACYISHMRRE